MPDVDLARALAVRGLDWIVPAWDAPPRVHAFATTRNGGAGPGSAAFFDVGGANYARDAADPAAIAANRCRIDALLPAPPVWLEQVHGCRVVVIDDANVDASRNVPPVADALVTRRFDVPLAIRVADCVPVLFAACDDTVIAAAHAGWQLPLRCSCG